MKVKLKEDLLYSKLTDLVVLGESGHSADDNEYLHDVITVFMNHGHILHNGNDLELYMTAGDIIDVREPDYNGPDYTCNYHGLILDLSTDGKLEVII